MTRADKGTRSLILNGISFGGPMAFGAVCVITTSHSIPSLSPACEFRRFLISELPKTCYANGLGLGFWGYAACARTRWGLAWVWLQTSVEKLESGVFRKP